LEQALGSGALLAVQPGRLELRPYQLVPALRAIRMSRVRLLLGDGADLGKTIQAGIVLTEFIARRVAARRCLPGSWGSGPTARGGARHARVKKPQFRLGRGES
jgi:hypothetical protein